ncbi:MAG: leucine-rich repeat domain-containing protein [Chitinophagales bacterium]|nr:leucine-rich repeat domain-containing protein [Chitinophagales bacterium]
MSLKKAEALIAENKKSKAPFLDLGNLGLTELPDSLFELEHLEGLNLGDVFFYRDMYRLSNEEGKNKLGSNKTGLYRLEELPLTTLYLSSNEISNVDFLKHLRGLQYLDLSYNKISDISSLKHLVYLQGLDLNSNEISNIRFLEYLTNLKNLDLSFNRIRDKCFLGSLKFLEILNLNSNQISNMRLGNKLQKLYLNANKISDISFVEHLNDLRHLDIRSNKIKDLLPIKRLLEKGVPVKWTSYGSNSINLHGNPIQNPPNEIIVQGKDAILAYFRQQEEQGTEPLMEAKLIIVGEPGAGKTSLMKKLIDETYPVPNPSSEAEVSTLGINVYEGWTFEMLDDKEKNFSANLWDFGGQEIQYMTHQFFLTPSALYVLVADDRKQHTNFPYWFEAVHLLGKEGYIQSPILVVLNENKHQSISNYDHKYFKKTYPNTRLEVLEVDLSKVDKRYYHLKEKVQEMLCQLPHVGYELPKKWKAIRADLRELAKEHNHIPEQHFFDVCKKHSIEREQDQLLLSSYLHKLGSILHFQNETTLQDFVILNPQWAVDAVYCILEDKTVKEAQGVFTKEKVDELWNAYSRKERAMLLSMMMKENFEICYAISKHKYIAPQLLDNIRPDYDWDNTQSLKFRYQYHFLPKGVITRLIVRLNESIAGHKGEHPGLVWEKGVVLEKDDCRAQVIEEGFPKQSIEIEIMGRTMEKKFVLRWVRNEIESIHQKWFPNVQFSQKIPCICDECRQEPEPYFFDYSRLVKFHERGRPSDVCDNSLEDISVRALLEGIYEKEEYMPEYAKELLDGYKSVKQKITREHNKTRKAISDFEARISDQFRGEYQEIKEHLESVTFSEKELQNWMEKLDAALENLSEQLSEAEAVKMQEALEVSKTYSPKHKLKLKLDLYFAAYEVEYDMKEVWSDFKRFLREKGNSK